MKLGDIVVIVIIILVAAAYLTLGFGKLPDSEQLITTSATTTVPTGTGTGKPIQLVTTTKKSTDPVLDTDYDITTWTMSDALSEIYIGDTKLTFPCTLSEIPSEIDVVKSAYDDNSGCVALNTNGSTVASGYYYLSSEKIYNLTLLNSVSHNISIYGIDGNNSISELEAKFGPANDKYSNEKIGYYQYSYIFDDNNYIVFEYSDNKLSSVNICCA